MSANSAFANATTDPVAERNAEITGQPPRITPLDPALFTDEQRAIAAANQGIAPTANSAESSAALLNEMVGIMVRAPAVYAPHMDSARAFFFRSSLTPRDRELVILRTAWLSQSPYEWGEHVRIGKDVGITSEEILQVIDGSQSGDWSDHDRALTALAEELHFNAMVSDETWAALQASFDEQQLIELVMLVGQYKAVAYYLNTLRIRLRADNQGLMAR